MFIKGEYKVRVGGIDVTSRFNPRVTSIEISKSAGQSADTLSINVADPNGQIALPKDRAFIEVTINGVDAFEGYVKDVNWSMDKKGGRSITISASSVDQGGKAKEPVLRNADDKDLGAVFKDWSSKAGLNGQAIGDIAKTNRSYWVMQNESFQSWGQRMARELGGTFRIIGKRAFIATRNEGKSVSGQPLTPISATIGRNLLSASVTPIISRPKYKDVEIAYFDPKKGESVKVKVKTGVENVDAALRTVITAATKEQAKEKADAGAKETDREQGGGSCSLIGDARAEPEAKITLSGCRPGIDGTYTINSVSHKISKGGGFTTDVEFKQPKSGAGKDAR